MLRELLKCSILISVVGCSSVPKEDNSSILMEDVIVERTTTRSTTQNPKPKSNGGIYISGDNINIGAIIVNSPNSVVDNSKKVVMLNQQNNYSERPTYSDGFIEYKNDPSPNQYYNNDANFFKGIDQVLIKLLPPFLTQNLGR
jgi:hypothetical protein